MTLTINDSSMTSDRTPHTARYAPDRNGWEVSWLPGQPLWPCHSEVAPPSSLIWLHLEGWRG